MRRRDRAILTAAALLSGIVLAGCETADMADKLGDAGDKLVDLIPGSTKKPLPGDRKPVFPEGIPGVSQGVPSDLIKGNQPPPEPEVQPPPRQAALDSDKPRPKPKKKAQTRSKPPEEASYPAESATPARPVQGGAWPAPPTQQPAASQWPAPPTQAPSSQTAWPAPPPAQR
jgi:outer membrane biosynthesis protein TonB